MRAEPLTRRRVITVLAAAAGSAVTGGPPSARAAADYSWRGVAMGADAQILFSGVGEDTARAASQTAAAEIARLERALSLFREDSEICRLNRDGALSGPSGDFRRALALAREIAAASGGLFDPTVQALWEMHADWFSAGSDRELPPDAAIAEALAKVDWRRIDISTEAISLGNGQHITLNGLGQGYVTDRVAALLYERGFDRVLVDLGEQRALGPRADGAPWLVARAGGDPIELESGALATSAGAGCILGAGGAAHHLFDPHSGRSARLWRRVTVHHRSAAVADALSTALYAAPAQEIEAIAARLGGIIVWATSADGREHRWSAPPLAGARAGWGSSR